MSVNVKTKRIAVQDVKIDDEILFFPERDPIGIDGDEVLHAGFVNSITNGRDEQNRMVIHLKIRSNDENHTITLVRGYDLAEKIIN